MPHHIRWPFYAAAGAIIYGIYQLLVKYILNKGMSVPDLIAWLGVIYGIGGIIYLIYNDKLKNFTQRKYDLLTLCVVVLLIHVLGDYCFNRGIKFAPNPGYVTAFMSLTIVFVYLSSLYYFKTAKFEWGPFIGIMLVCGGILLLTMTCDAISMEAPKLKKPKMKGKNVLIYAEKND